MRTKKLSKLKLSSNGDRLQENGEGTPLGFLLAIIPPKKGMWTLERAQEAVELIRARMPTEAIAKQMGMSFSGTQQLIKELRLAAEKGYTLEKYFRLGRPFMYGKQPLNPTA